MILSTTQSLIIIAVVAVCTFVLRISPFVLFGQNEPPKIITYLGGILPPAIMAVLVVYCFKGMQFSSLAGFAPLILSGVVVAALQAWKSKSLISIVLGTACYMFLVQVVFV